MKHRLLTLFTFGIGLLSTPAYATPESHAAANFLLFAPSARAAGMGNAYVAIADDANATYYNPRRTGLIANSQSQHHPLQTRSSTGQRHLFVIRCLHPPV